MKANVVYIESPPGVGFSTTEDYSWNDASTASINLDALIEWFV
jgi:carboxypeptidase C (cathepsin A)